MCDFRRGRVLCVAAGTADTDTAALVTAHAAAAVRGTISGSGTCATMAIVYAAL